MQGLLEQLGRQLKHTFSLAELASIVYYADSVAGTEESTDDQFTLMPLVAVKVCNMTAHEGKVHFKSTFEAQGALNG